MARQKNRPESVRVKYRLAERLHEIRTELFGERGGSEMARRLGLPVRTWYNYEAGVTVPAEVLLRFVELTSVEPLWLLHGRGPRFRKPPELQPLAEADSVQNLLRTALRRLEQKEPSAGPVDGPSNGNGQASEPIPTEIETENIVLVRVEGADRERLTDRSQPGYIAAHREWLEACRDCRCVQVEGDAMTPILATGACVAYADSEEPYDALIGSLVVAWINGQPIVRWFDRSGRYGLLQAENSSHEPSTQLIDLEGPPHERHVRRVLWISTPH